jgi:hypothetical protein
MNWYHVYMSRAFMSFRECWITDRRRETQEEVVADLHSCLEQLTFRGTEMETKMESYRQKALYHLQLSKREATQTGSLREKTRARIYLQDRRRIQVEYDKTLKSMHMLQQQIDSIVSSHVDMVIVDAMRNFNATAAKMGLSQRVAEIERLGDSLADRQHEVNSMQDAMATISAVGPIDDQDEADLMCELDLLLASELSPPATARPTAAPSPPPTALPTAAPSPPSTALPSPPSTAQPAALPSPPSTQTKPLIEVLSSTLVPEV